MSRGRMMRRILVALVVGAAVAFGVVGCGGGGGTSYTADWVAAGNTSNVGAAYKDQCREVDYRDFQKSSSAHEGEALYVKGTVIEITQPLASMTVLGLGVGGTGSDYDAIIVVVWPGSLSAVYRDSIVEVWGDGGGSTDWGGDTYPSVKARFLTCYTK